MSISQNFPDEGPSLNLNFASSRILDPRITFTRTSTGTYTDKNGLVTIAPTDTPRFDHSYDGSNVQSLGLLIEESRSNLVTYSEDYSINTTTINASITTNTITAPDGTLTADMITASAGNAQHGPNKSSTGLPINSVCSLSVFVKAGTHNFCRLDSSNITNWSTNAGVTVNLTNGTIISGSGTVEPYPNGWYRITIYPTSNSTAGVSRGMWVWVTGSNGSSAYDAVVTETIHVWGAQLEAGAFPTSYIPTVASTVTRSADNASMTGTNFTSWYNSTEGTLFAAARINALGGSNYPGIAYVDDGTVSNCIGFYINDAGSDTIGAEAYISNVAQYGLSSSATTANQLNKVISAYKVNDFAATFNIGSNTVQTDTSGSVPTVNRLIIGLLRGSNAPLNGTVAQFLYYPRRLTNTQLQNLTK